MALETHQLYTLLIKAANPKVPLKAVEESLRDRDLYRIGEGDTAGGRWTGGDPS